MAFRVLVGIILFTSAFALPGSPQGLSSHPETPTNLLARRSSPSRPYQSPGWIPFGQSLEPQLSQEKTNGKSVLGTSKAPKLPHYLPDPSDSGKKRWDRRAPKDADFGYDIPNTGVTRHYDFTVSELDIAPDGVTRSGMVVNGAFPGPTIQANWGDYIEVTVHNNLSYEGTSIHWHGLLQRETPYFDGVPGTQQCPMPPNTSFTYKFRADLYGTSFWHSHYSAQYTGGIFGAMVIHGPHENADYDEDLGPVIVNDWYHEDYYSLVEQSMAPISKGLGPPVSTNNFINGKMNYPCANATGYTCIPNAGLSKFFVESGKTYRIRLINAGAEGLQKFSIDGAMLTVIANDFVPVVPYKTDVITLGIGQRTDVLFEASGNPRDSVWMRSTLGKSGAPTDCTLNDGVSPEAVAAIYYEKADSSSIPRTRSSVLHSKIQDCLNDPIERTVPYYSLTPTEPDTIQRIRITLKSNGTHYLFYMNNSTFRANYNDPVLLRAKLGNTTFPEEFNVFNFGQSKSIRMIISNHAQTSAHPMHLHGHNMYVLAIGEGDWDGTITNPHNPLRRDVILLPNAPSETKPAYAVVQIDADNPGVWPFHCHIAWHVSQGLYIGVMERPDEIKDISVPPSLAQTCRDWAKWTNTEIPNEIDSGL